MHSSGYDRVSMSTAVKVKGWSDSFRNVRNGGLIVVALAAVGVGAWVALAELGWVG
jgi:hypothetical protein